MFQKSSKNNSTESVSINLIGNGTAITGDIKSSGDIRIDGILNGNITINGKLVIGSTGKIEGNIICQNADISGEIKGKINVSELLILKSSAKLVGDIITGKISIEPNATFTGSCNMGAVVKNISHVSETNSESTSKTA